MFERFRLTSARLWNWLWSKRTEVTRMDYRDVYMGHIVLEIMQTSKEHHFSFIPLSSCRPIHPIDNRPATVQATKKRSVLLLERKTELLQKKQLSKEVLAELMPSATYLRAIADGDGGYYTFEGNGRVAALAAVFSKEDEIQIEVDLYQPKHAKRVRKKVEKLRKMHQL